MKLKFKCDYVGRETAGKRYHAGDVAEIPTEYALEILRLGGAEEMPDPVVEVMMEIEEALDSLPPTPKRKKVKHEQDAQ